MTVYNLINSQDIANHLQQIGYEFSSLEVAWLIWRSKRLNLSQRHKAWREVISCMPDCKIKATENLREIPSLHEYLEHLINAHEAAKKVFFEPEPNCYFNGEIVGDSFSGWDPSAFSTFEACIAHLDTYETNPENILRYEISKFRLVGEVYEKETTLIFDCNMQIRDIDTMHFKNIFSFLYFDFPVPFKKGDILMRSKSGGPTISEQYFMEKVVYLSHGSAKDKRISTTDDMKINGYFWWYDGLRLDAEANYMDFELVNSKLESNERFLTITSNLLKEKLDIIEYAEMYHLIKSEMELEARSSIHEKLNSR